MEYLELIDSLVNRIDNATYYHSPDYEHGVSIDYTELCIEADREAFRHPPTHQDPFAGWFLLRDPQKHKRNRNKI